MDKQTAEALKKAFDQAIKAFDSAIDEALKNSEIMGAQKSAADSASLKSLVEATVASKMDAVLASLPVAAPAPAPRPSPVTEAPKPMPSAASAPSVSVASVTTPPPMAKPAPAPAPVANKAKKFDNLL